MDELFTSWVEISVGPKYKIVEMKVKKNAFKIFIPNRPIRFYYSVVFEIVFIRALRSNRLFVSFCNLNVRAQRRY